MIFLLLLWIFPFLVADPYSFRWNSGGFEYSCDGLGSGWQLAGESCFYPYSAISFNFSTGGAFCRNRDLHFAIPAIVDNWLVAGSLRSKVEPRIYWTGVTLLNESSLSLNPLNFIDSAFNPLWAVDQPPIHKTSTDSCVALDLTSADSIGWRLMNCSEQLPILCQTFACLPDKWRCMDNSRCIPASAYHDGFRDCLDGSDESSGGQLLSRFSSQTDCRHVLMRGSGEFSSPQFPDNYPKGSTCRWDLEASDGKAVAFTIDRYEPSSYLSVNGDSIPIELPWDRTESLSTRTDSRLVTIRLRSTDSGKGFRIRFYSAEKTACTLVDGVAVYDSLSTPFDCSFQAAAPITTQFLLFMVESMDQSSSASVNVTGAGYSFGFTGSDHSQAVVIPSSEATLTVQDAWKSQDRTAFRIRVIPFGSTCLVIPLTVSSLSLHWPCQRESTFIPHCLSFAFVGHRKHTWRVDSLSSTRADAVGLTTKTAELALSSVCTYRNENSVTLSIKQLSPEFTMSFKVSEDCDWPSGSYSFGSEVACLEGSTAESSECLMGGQWSVSPSLCLSLQTLQSESESQPDRCTLPWLKTSYPIAANYTLGSKLIYTCRPTFFPNPEADCDSSTGICSATCSQTGTEFVWDPSPECLETPCDRPKDHLGASPIITSNVFPFGNRTDYQVPVGKVPGATAYAFCGYLEGQIYKPGWSYYGFKFVDQICLAFPVLYGSFNNQTYAYGETGTITCIPGYSLQGTTVCMGGTWTNPNIFCDYVSSDESTCQPGAATVLNGTTVCTCPYPYIAVGSPNNQTCQPFRNRCQDGTNLCDLDAICNVHPLTPLGYNCLCPKGKLLWENETQNGLLQNISCYSNCTLAGINLGPDQFLHGYQDPPGDQPYSVYCKKNVSSLGNLPVYIQSKRFCEGIWYNACTVPCDSAGENPLNSFPYPSYPYDMVDNSCPRDYKLIGPQKSVCGLRGAFFVWNNDQEQSRPLCHMPQCSRLDVLYPANFVNSTSPYGLDFALNATVFLQGCIPNNLTCVMNNATGQPMWNTGRDKLVCTGGTSPTVYASTLGWGSSSLRSTFGSTSSNFGSSPGSTTDSFGSSSGSTTDFLSWTTNSSGSIPGSTTDSLGSTSQSLSTVYIPWTQSTSWSSPTRTTRSTFSTTIPTAKKESDMSDCTDDLNNCSNGHCNITTRQCECLDGFYPDSSGLQCVQIPNYGIWCSSEGEVQDDGTCYCRNDFGAGGYNDSSLCMDGPSVSCTSDYQNAFIPNVTDPASLLQTCIKELNKTLVINGDSGSTCQCKNGICAGTLYENSLPCICDHGFAGELCDVSLACQDVTCLNGGTCKDGSCHCPPGWSSTDCSQLIIRNNCLPHNNCSPSSSFCHTTYNSTFCLCDAGYTGPLCDVPILYCDLTNPCVNGNCTNALNNLVGVRCDCQSGYDQPYCDSPSQKACQPNSCGGNLCIELVYPDYVCNCEDNNFKPTGSQPDNCAATASFCTPELSPCFNQGTCTDIHNPTQHEYFCNCTGEYSGTWCQRDLCAGVNCVHGVCLQQGVCQCDPGWTGSLCDSPIPCTLHCEHDGTCQLDSNNDPYCNCSDPWTGSLCTKSKINCTNTCQHGVCYHDTEGFYCNCTAAYEGINCEQLKSCTEMGFVCENGGTCRVTEEGNKNCTCPIGVHGDSCETLGIRCTPTLCLNGATCQEDIFLNARCICTENYEGEYCQTKRNLSFDLLWTGFPSNQDFVSSPLITSLYREFSLCGWVQYAPSVPATSSTALPPFMGIRTSTNLQVLTVDNLGVLIDNNRIMNISIPALQWHHVCIIAPVYNTGRQTWTYFLDGMPVRNSTYQALPQNNVTLYMVALAPGNQFQGELSLVQLFFERLNDTQIASMAFDCANTTFDFGNSPLLLNWNTNFTTLDRSNPGVMQVQPGICDISNCLPGRPCGTVDKIPPVVTSCPGPIRLQSDQKFTTVSWTPPTFQDNVAVSTVTSNLRPGQLFPWGYYQVIYVAKDSASNSVTCQFPVIVAPNDCLAADPPGGRVERLNVNGTNSQMVVRLTCIDEAFPKTDPDFFVCDDLGQWDRISSFSLNKPYSFPSCGNTTDPTQTINGTVTGNGTSCDDIYSKLNSTLSNVTSSVCSDAKCFEIYPQCSDVGKARKRGIINDFTQLFEYRIIVNNTRDMLQSTVQDSVKNTFPDGQPTSDAYFDCDPEFPCGKPDDSQYSCANCAPGTWWNASETSCVDCPPDSYRMHPPIDRCVLCDVGKTTGGLSKVASVEGCYKNCSVGYYYNSQPGVQDCRPCGPGTYQPDTGRTECLTCPLYTSTFGEGRTNEEDCTNTCEPGKEFESNMVNCTNCPIGTYKNGTNSGCTTCDTGRTTASTGSKLFTDCDVVWCPPGTMVSPNLTLPLPPPGQGNLYSFCPLCEMGTFSTDYNQTICMNCTDQDQAPTCALSSECAPSLKNSCPDELDCIQRSSSYATIPIYQCSSTVTAQPIGKSHNTAVIVWVAVGVSILVMVVALAVIAWIFRDRLPCYRFGKSENSGLPNTSQDFYRAPRIHHRRALSDSTASSKSDTEIPYIPESPPERPRMLPPPVITSRLALEALNAQKSPPTPYTIPRIPQSMRTLPESDEEPVFEEQEDDDDDYFS